MSDQPLHPVSRILRALAFQEAGSSLYKAISETSRSHDLEGNEEVKTCDTAFNGMTKSEILKFPGTAVGKGAWKEFLRIMNINRAHTF